jgi:hypothetical protein
MHDKAKTILLFSSIVIVGLFSFSCKTKQTCAAYHSHFLLFPEVQDKYFSLFEETDSAFAPKENLVSSDKLWNGISVGPNNKRNYKKRHYVIPMKDVYREIEADSTGGTSMINLDSTKNQKVFSN